MTPYLEQALRDYDAGIRAGFAEASGLPPGAASTGATSPDMFARGRERGQELTALARALAPEVSPAELATLRLRAFELLAGFSAPSPMAAGSSAPERTSIGQRQRWAERMADWALGGDPFPLPDAPGGPEAGGG